ncbi:MAG TPA: AMP-binding protein [Acidimicrobiales bacterium]|nr:AMP-binding protein [Acidimicrobiales bacterium]
MPPASDPVESPLRGSFATLGEAMEAAAVQLRDHEAYVEDGRRITFGNWIGAADALAATLAERGVRAGDVVALMLPPCIDYAVCYAAAVRMGAVVTGINTRLGPREVAAIVDRAEPVLVIRDEQLPLARLPAHAPVMARADLAAACAGPVLPARPASARPDDPVVIIWTSGTTGLPRGAWFDHPALHAAVDSAGVLSRPFDRRLSSTPFAHAGYMAKVWEQLAWATTIVISPTPWSADDTVRLLDHERITVAGAVPTQWAKALDHPQLAQADRSQLRLCVTATAPPTPELVERMAVQLGCPAVVRYAMTEAPSITGTEPGDPPDALFHSVGRPQAGVEVDLRDGAGRPVPAGEAGRVHVRSAGAMRGYWRDEEHTAEVLGADGWLRSGDVGRWDADGNLVLVGRASDMYIRGGYNVYPLEVENVLVEHPAVAGASVVGVMAPVIGEIGVAFVVPDAHAPQPQATELQAWCRRHLTDYKVPDEVVFVDALPLTAMLKVDKAALRAMADAPGG